MLIPAFTDVTGEPKAVPVMVAKVLSEVTDVLLHEIAEGQDQKYHVKPHSEGYRFSVLVASSLWALTVPGWRSHFIACMGCGDATEQLDGLHLLMLESTG